MNENDSCHVCKMIPFKYSCPACKIKTCSIACIDAHKNIYKCSGKRSRTTFVSKSEYDINTFVNDYWLLEDTGQLVDRAIVKSQECFGMEKKNKSKRKTIDSIIGGRQGLKTLVRWLPSTFQRSRENKTRILNRNHIEWYVCWIIANSIMTDSNKMENQEIQQKEEIIKSENDIERERRQYSSMSENDIIIQGFESLFPSSLINNINSKSLSFEIINEPKDVAPFPTRITGKCTLKEALLGVTIIEYPIIRVTF